MRALPIGRFLGTTWKSQKSSMAICSASTRGARLGNSLMSCFNVGDHNILLCERERSVDDVAERDHGVHHSFTVSPETFVQGCKVFHESGVPILGLVYRAVGHFTGAELYFSDPSGNRLELRDPTWQEGMPEPSFDEIVRS